MEGSQNTILQKTLRWWWLRHCLVWIATHWILPCGINLSCYSACILLQFQQLEQTLHKRNFKSWSENFLLISEAEIFFILSSCEVEDVLQETLSCGFFPFENSVAILKVLQEVHLGFCLTECMAEEQLLSLVLYALNVLRSDKLVFGWNF